MTVIRVYFSGKGRAVRVCAECQEVIEPDEAAVPSRAIQGAPLVHEECAG